MFRRGRPVNVDAKRLVLGTWYLVLGWFPPEIILLGSLLRGRREPRPTTCKGHFWSVGGQGNFHGRFLGPHSR